MKKYIIPTVAALFLGTVGVAYATQTGDNQESTYETPESEVLSDEVFADMNEEFAEYELVSEQIDLDSYEAKVVEDNKAKRIIVFADESGEETYKTIFNKKTGYVKVIEFDKGQVFNGNIDGKKEETVKEEKTSEKEETKTETNKTVASDKLSDYKEYKTVKEHIDMDKHTGKVVEDNKNKRVILYRDADGHKQYKSIYVKHKNHVKIIDFNGGLVYQGTIGGEKQATKTEQPKKEQVKKEEPKQETQKSSGSKISQYTEYGTISNHIDVDKYTAKVVTDNPGNRVIIFSDSNGHKQYKSIYAKKKGFLKIIHFDGGLVYKG